MFRGTLVLIKPARDRYTSVTYTTPDTKRSGFQHIYIVI